MAKRDKYLVYVEQVNQQCIEVMASSREEAEDKAIRKWRREQAWPAIREVEVEVLDGVRIK